MNKLAQDQIDLDAYARTGSNEALGSLAGRYVNLVYGVAIREMRDVHLAEDVSQAAFIVLARRAGRIRARALSSWLFVTTRNLAANARKAAARRDYHERRAAEMKREIAMSAVESTDQSAIESMQSDLHSALSVAREADRSIVLMRYVQEMEIPEISHALGVSEMVVRKRLSRAIERLRRLMMRRSGAVEATALCAALGGVAQAAPLGIVQAVSQGVSTSGSAAALAKASITWLPLNIAAAIVIFAGLSSVLAAGIWHCMTRSAAVVVTTVVAPATAPTKDAKLIVYRGAITAPDGSPVTGARVWSELLIINPARAKRVEVETTTDASGRYVLPPVPQPETSTQRDTDPFEFLERVLHVDHPSYAIAWRSGSWRDRDEEDQVVNAIQLQAAADLRVKVIDEATGKPLADADVSLEMEYPIGTLDLRSEGYGRLTWPGRGEAIKTDAEGIAVFRRLPREARAQLVVLRDGYARYETRELYRQYPPLRPGASMFTVALKPGGQLRLRAASGVAELQAMPLSGGRANYRLGEFDSDGFYTMRGLPVGKYNLIMRPLGGTVAESVWPIARNITIAAGQTAQVVIQPIAGQVVSGRTIDNAIKQPVEGTRVYSTLIEGASRNSLSRALTDKNGRFSMRLPPGTYEISPMRKTITVPANPSPGQDIGDYEVAPPLTARGRLVDPSGKPVSGMVITSQDKVVAAADGSFALPLRRPGPVDVFYFYALSQDKMLAAAFTNEERFTDPKLALPGANLPIISLRAAAKIVGRTVDANGQPLTDATLQFNLPLTETTSLGMQRPLWGGFTYDAGRFTFDHFPTGAAIKMRIDWRDMQAMIDLSDLKPGEMRDLGDVVITDRSSRPVNPHRDFTGKLAGTVVDQDAKPLMGIRVGAVPDGGGVIGQQTTDVSDQDGRFFIDGLAKGELTLFNASAEGFRRKNGSVQAGEENLVIQLTPEAGVSNIPPR